MKFPLATPAIIGIFLILTGCSQTPPDTREADTKTIKDIETQWNADFKAKDADKVLAHYTSDAVLMGPGEPAASSADARKTMISELVNDPAFSLSFETASVDVARSGDLAATRGTYTLGMTDPRTKKPIVDHGSYVTVYKKQADGMWKAVSDINVSDAPPAAATPAPVKRAAAKQDKAKQGKKKRK
jgi:uncharacterized protein (TIGR02246 family)